MEKQINEVIKFFENEIVQYEIKLKGIVSNDYKEHLENVLSYYKIVLYALNELLK